MEKYVSGALLLTPGFIAKYTASNLGGKQSKSGEVDTVLIYFGYSLSAITVTLLGASLLGMFSVNDPWSVFEANLLKPLFGFQFLVLQVVCSVAVGAFWELLLQKRILSLFSWLTMQRGEVKSISVGSLLHELFYDGKDHFLLLEKEGKELAVGFFRGVSAPGSENRALHIATGQVYSELFQYAKNHPEHPLHTPLGVYLDLDSDLVIKEYAYPDDLMPPSS